MLSTIAVAQNWTVLATNFATVGLACLLFNLTSLAIGYALPRAVKLPVRQATAIAMEIGVHHNSTLAIFIAFNVLNNGALSVPAAIYSLVMFVTASLFAWWANKRSRV